MKMMVDRFLLVSFVFNLGMCLYITYLKFRGVHNSVRRFFKSFSFTTEMFTILQVFFLIIYSKFVGINYNLIFIEMKIILIGLLNLSKYLIMLIPSYFLADFIIMEKFKKEK